MEAEVICRSRSETLTRWIGNCTCRLHAHAAVRVGQAGSRRSMSRVFGFVSTYLIGDATALSGRGPGVIAHVCNDSGGWGKGFVLAINRRWAEPEAAYRSWARSGQEFGLGMVQLVRVDDHLRVANMVAQHGYVSRANPVAIRYDA